MILLLISHPFSFGLMLIAAFMLGCVISELDWKFSSFWDDVRPRKKKKNENK
jgi:hypothetical protein